MTQLIIGVVTAPLGASLIALFWVCFLAYHFSQATSNSDKE